MVSIDIKCPVDHQVQPYCHWLGEDIAGSLEANSGAKIPLLVMVESISGFP